MSLRPISLTALTIALVACADDGSSPNVGALTREEALLVAGAISNSAQTTTAAPSSQRTEIAAVPLTFTHEFDASHPCPKGGSIALTYRASGTIDTEARSFDLDVAGTQRPAACAFEHKGVTITVSGNPEIAFEAHAAAENNRPSEPYRVTVSGGFTYTTSDGRSGECGIQYAEVIDFLAKRRTVEGNVCGHSVTETFTWS